MQTLNIEGKVRSSIGKVASKMGRKNNLIPCNLYGSGDNINFESTEKELHSLIYTPNFYKVNLTIDGVNHEALMREIQFHPVTDKVMHVDFLRLDAKKEVTVKIPLKLIGQSSGVKAGGKLSQKIRQIQIKALPKNLVDHVDVDITELEIGKSIRLGDIKIDNVEVIGSKSIPVVNCLVPRAAKVEEAKTTTTAAAPAASDAKTDDKSKDKK